MLQLFNYDLQDPLKNFPTLQGAIADAGGGIHVVNGPWIYGGNMSPQEVLKAVTNSLKAKKAKANKLLVFPVPMGEIGTGRNLAQWPIEHTTGDKVFAVTCTLRETSRKHRQDVTDALESFKERCHPLDDLWFVKTTESAHDIRLEIEKAAPLCPKDELMVAEVNGHPVKGAAEGLDPEDRVWLEEAGVL